MDMNKLEQAVDLKKQLEKAFEQRDTLQDLLDKGTIIMHSSKKIKFIFDNNATLITYTNISKEEETEIFDFLIDMRQVKIEKIEKLIFDL